MKRLAVLGSTGSVGEQTLEVVAANPEKFRVVALAAGQNVAGFIVMFFLMLYLLFFVLRDGHLMLEAIIRALPLGDERERALFAKFAEVSRATIKGTLLIGLIQGALGGLIFAILGIQGAVFWGVVMVFVSILPAVGASLVWIPAAGFLLAAGAWGKAVVLVLLITIPLMIGSAIKQGAMLSESAPEYAETVLNWIGSDLDEAEQKILEMVRELDWTQLNSDTIKQALGLGAGAVMTGIGLVTYGAVFALASSFLGRFIAISKP